MVQYVYIIYTNKYILPDMVYCVASLNNWNKNSRNMRYFLVLFSFEFKALACQGLVIHFSWEGLDF